MSDTTLQQVRDHKLFAPAQFADYWDEKADEGATKEEAEQLYLEELERLESALGLQSDEEEEDCECSVCKPPACVPCDCSECQPSDDDDDEY